MKNHCLLGRLFPRASLLAALISVGSASLSASVLMFDFGTAAATGADLTNSPLHSADGSFTDTSWNSINSTTTGAKTGFTYSDGTAATGVSLYVGRSSNNPWSTLTFAGGPTNVTSTSNPASLDGVFASATSIGRDGHYAAYASGTGDPTLTRIMGVSVAGLNAGTYDIYLVGLNPGIAMSTAASMGFWAVELAGTANYDASTLVSGGPQAVSTNSVSSSWVEGSNYVKLTFTKASNDSYLTFLTVGQSEAETRGYLNSIQIVAVPEPASAGLWMALVVAVGVASKRRRGLVRGGFGA